MMADSTFNTMEQDELLEGFNFREMGTDLRGLALKAAKARKKPDPTEEEKIELWNRLCEKSD
jgi:hypothetical protein